ncbi:MAG TPA: AMP-binding protein [Streptosporangiaceae bacterium]
MASPPHGRPRRAAPAPDSPAQDSPAQDSPELDSPELDSPGPDGWTLDSWSRHLGRRADPAALAARLTAGSLPEAVSAAAAAAPRRLALRIDDEDVTHGELDDAAGRGAAWLHGQGVRPGHRVLLAGAGSADFVRAYLAALRAGATVVPASPMLTAAELAALCEQAQVTMAFADHSSAGLLAGAASGLPVTRIGPHPGGGTGRPCGPALREVLSGQDPVPAGPADPDAPAILAYTSGTTGLPKGVPLTHANLLSSIRAAMLAWRWNGSDVLVHALPLTHQHGLGGVHATLLAGSRAVLCSRFEPARLARLAGQARATILFAVPAMYQRLTGLPRAGLAPLRGLRLAVSGSAPLDPALARRAGAALGQLPLERYGTTESGLGVSALYDGPRVAGSVGRPLPGVRLRIADPDGRPLPPGEPGEILLAGPQVFGGYLGPAGQAGQAFHPGGWFRTGDLGRIEPASGGVEITGRIKELIISGGFNVTPREVELVLEQHPAVSEAAVAGLPSARWGEEVAAWVVPVPGAAADPAGLIAHARARLAVYKCPKQVFLVDSLPRNSLGKVLRRTLRPPPVPG